MFRLSIVTPEKVFYDGEVASLVVHGSEGYLGVLSNHAPLITALQPGRLEFRDKDNKVEVMAATNGFLEVSNNVATILCDAVERSSDIDIQRAQEAYDRAKSRLVSLSSKSDEETSIDRPRARAALERAQARLKVYKETH
jgi:F-type H+-transporting ATPase subunit epsilon